MDRTLLSNYLFSAQFHELARTDACIDLSVSCFANSHFRNLQSLISYFNYLDLSSGLDICFATNALNLFVENLEEVHLTDVKCFLITSEE